MRYDDTESLAAQVAALFARDPRAPRIFIGEVSAAYWALLMRQGDHRWMWLWRQLIHDAVDAGIRTAETAAEMDGTILGTRRRR
jgi:hypothetical protein